MSHSELRGQQHKEGMLQISLRPTLIPGKLIIQCWRGFFIAMGQRRFQPHFVSGPPQKRRFRELFQLLREETAQGAGLAPPPRSGD